MKKLVNGLIGLVVTLAVSGCASKSMPQEAPAQAPQQNAAQETPIPSESLVEKPVTIDLPNAQFFFRDGATGDAIGEIPELISGREIDNSPNGEQYLAISENQTTSTDVTPMLTFSLKVDTASYSNVARYLESGNLPPTDAVKVEEMINYFNYDEKLESTDAPFSIYTEIGPSPFDANKNLAFVRVKSKDVDKADLPNSNLTFLIDTSGSMNEFDKLPLLKSAFSLLTETLGENDVVSIVTYAGSAGVVIDSVHGDSKNRIMSAINDLNAGGSTAGAEGILTAYKLAEKNFIKGGNNRVILATDGDFNVGVSSTTELEDLIASKRDSGVYLSVLGFGTGNLQDDTMETLSKHGNGNYGYIDTVSTAKKILVDEMGTNMFTIADDVKAQVEFNPALVSDYRLIGYENRRLENKDFEDDKKDAGEIGLGTDVVMMFELTLKDNANNPKGTKYQPTQPETTTANKFADELFEVRIRYKDPGQTDSKLITDPVKIDRIFQTNTSDYYFASTVAAFGNVLRQSEHAENINVKDLITTAKSNLGQDKGGYRKEFVEHMKQFENIK